MLPLSDVIPSRTTPLVTFTIVIAGALVFIFGLSLDSGAARTLARTLGATPADFPDVGVVTSMVLQASGWQFVANMLLLTILGETLEDRLGHARFLLLYVAAGVVTVGVHTALDPLSSVPMAGASGALAGVLGGYFVTYPQSKVLTLAPVPTFITEVPAVLFLGLWWVIELLSRFHPLAEPAGDGSGNPALQALGAAFAAGALLGKLLQRPVRWDDTRDPRSARSS